MELETYSYHTTTIQLLNQENNCSSFVSRSNSRSANLPISRGDFRSPSAMSETRVSDALRYLFVWIYFKKTTHSHLSHPPFFLCFYPHSPRPILHSLFTMKYSPSCPKFGIFVPNIYFKSRRIILGTPAERVSASIRVPFPMIPVVHTSFHTISPASANSHKKCIMPKGKMHINRGSNPPPYLPSPFLSFIKTPWVCMSMKNPPSTNCLNIIEPLFEPPTARGRLIPPPIFLFQPLRVLFTIHYSPFASSCHCEGVLTRGNLPTSTYPACLNLFLCSLNTEYRKLNTDDHSPFPAPMRVLAIHGRAVRRFIMGRIFSPSASRSFMCMGFRSLN
jgi:hypothetical protein